MSLASLTGVSVCGRYAKTDAASLAYLRRELLRPHYTAVEVGVGVTVAASVVGGLSTAHSLQRSPVGRNALLEAYSEGLSLQIRDLLHLQTVPPIPAKHSLCVSYC